MTHIAGCGHITISEYIKPIFSWEKEVDTWPHFMTNTSLIISPVTKLYEITPLFAPCCDICYEFAYCKIHNYEYSENELTRREKYRDKKWYKLNHTIDDFPGRDTLEQINDYLIKNTRPISSNINDTFIHKKSCRECKKIKQELYDKNIVCKETKLCIHNNNINHCKECGYGLVCLHNNIWEDCYKCKNECRHKINICNCRICGGWGLCKNKWCDSLKSTNKKYNGYCLRCFVNMFPELPNSRNYKTKENDVVTRIKQNFPLFDWITDKRIKDGCSKRRPDLLLDLGTHIIIVEIDENKHSDYECSCENKRLMELSQDSEHRPIIFIRFNPDGYNDINGNKIKSCWKLNKLGIMCIEKTKNIEWIERINTLNQQIQYWIDNPNEKMIEIIELFY